MPGVHGPGDYSGNEVALEIEPGVYAFYAHLQPGSITVDIGDEVASGDVLGLLGNTGNTTAPHLHFGLIDNPAAVVGRALPLTFASWTLEGGLDQQEIVDLLTAGPGGAPLTPSGETGPQTGTFPLHLEVVDFG